MSDLAPIDRVQAERFLARVAWADRFPATVNGKRGFNRVSVYSVEELVRLASGGAVVISAPALAEWIGDVLGDVELADAIRAAAFDTPLFGQAAAVLPLIRERQEQALAALGAAGSPN